MTLRIIGVPVWRNISRQLMISPYYGEDNETHMKDKIRQENYKVAVQYRHRFRQLFLNLQKYCRFETGLNF